MSQWIGHFQRTITLLTLSESFLLKTPLANTGTSWRCTLETCQWVHDNFMPVISHDIWLMWQMKLHDMRLATCSNRWHMASATCEITWHVNLVAPVFLHHNSKLRSGRDSPDDQQEFRNLNNFLTAVRSVYQDQYQSDKTEQKLVSLETWSLKLQSVTLTACTKGKRNGEDRLKATLKIKMIRNKDNEIQEEVNFSVKFRT